MNTKLSSRGVDAVRHGVRRAAHDLAKRVGSLQAAVTCSTTETTMRRWMAGACPNYTKALSLCNVLGVDRETGKVTP